MASYIGFLSIGEAVSDEPAQYISMRAPETTRDSQYRDSQYFFIVDSIKSLNCNVSRKAIYTKVDFIVRTGNLGTAANACALQNGLSKDPLRRGVFQQVLLSHFSPLRTRCNILSDKHINLYGCFILGVNTLYVICI